MTTELPDTYSYIPRVRLEQATHIDLTNGTEDKIQLTPDLNQNSFYFFDRKEDSIELGSSIKTSDLAITSGGESAYIYSIDDKEAITKFKTYGDFRETFTEWDDSRARSMVAFTRRPQLLDGTNILLALENTNASAEDIAQQLAGGDSTNHRTWEEYPAFGSWSGISNKITTIWLGEQQPKTNADKITKPTTFKVKSIDKITNFNPSTDTLEIDTDSFGIDSSATFASGKNKKTVKKKLAKQDFDFLYDEKKGGLYFNENGLIKGFGDGGIIAILKGAPELTSDNLEFI